MLSNDIIELFRQSRETMPEDTIVKIDEIWDELVEATSSGQSSAAESDVAAEGDYNETAEKTALAKLTVLMQDTVNDLEEQLDNKRKELDMIESGNRYLRGEKIYPNEPCPCGSGKKYKKCCGRLK